MTPTVVVTASHCTDGMSSTRAYFDVEVTDGFRNDPKKGVTGTPVTHPQFNRNNLDNDVAVVLLDKSARLGEYPVLTAEGFLSDLKAAGDIDDDTFLAVGYGGPVRTAPRQPHVRSVPAVRHVRVRGPHTAAAPPGPEPQDRRGRDVRR
jgi:hypothetical protein